MTSSDWCSVCPVWRAFSSGDFGTRRDQLETKWWRSNLMTQAHWRVNAALVNGDNFEVNAAGQAYLDLYHRWGMIPDAITMTSLSGISCLIQRQQFLLNLYLPVGWYNFSSNCLVVSVVGSGILALNSNQDLMDRLPQGNWSQKNAKL